MDASTEAGKEKKNRRETQPAASQTTRQGNWELLLQGSDSIAYTRAKNALSLPDEWESNARDNDQKNIKKKAETKEKS